VHSSEDLVTWRYEGDAFPPAARQTGVYFRPKVIYNKQNKEYVLWVNLLPFNYSQTPRATPLGIYPSATYVVAKSSSPIGPFEIVTASASLSVEGAGDLNIMVDENETAYVVYGAWSNSHSLVVEQLLPSYYDSMPATAVGPITTQNNEAPIFFWRRSRTSSKITYYILYGPTCCFCPGGSGAIVMVADHPLGPWRDTGVDLNPTKGKGLNKEYYVKGQNNYVFLANQFCGAEDAEFIFTSDLWHTAPGPQDRRVGVSTWSGPAWKSRDLQYWQKLTFNDAAYYEETDAPTINPLSEDLESWPLTLFGNFSSYVPTSYPMISG